MANEQFRLFYFSKMKQKLLSAILAILFPVSAFCADYDAFTAEVCGTEMSFLVLSETDKTCVAYNKQNACINQSYTGEIIIPSEVNGYTVIEIGYNAFNSCLGVTSVTIPNTVTTISNHAFYRCI